MEMGGNFCQILELGGTTIKGRRVVSCWQYTLNVDGNMHSRFFIIIF